MRSRTYPVTLWKEEGIWTAHTPAISGLYGMGKTPAAACRDLALGMRDVFAYLDEIGEPRPAPIPVRAGRVAA
ncbi:MAG: hypothetical protein AABZ30_07335 [Myxococcota bacterium]